MHMHMVTWLDFYAKFLLRRPLQPDDYIFPTIGANGVSVHPDRPLSSDMVQKKIVEMAMKAGIKGAEKYTTHCFRRGGAQYRFMYAPITKRWSLAQIRWWGGWAQREHVSSETSKCSHTSDCA
jgi:integrase